MRKYKIAVYAICKNEEKFINKWVASMSEADAIFVLDTGSTDNSVRLLKELNVNVKSQIIKPWRFDVARNTSLALVPEDFDICVCTDLDEEFHKGWRDIIEEKWLPETKQLRYRYTWNFNSNGTEGTVFWIEKIHSRKDFQWVNPVHEILQYTGEAGLVYTEAIGIQLDHHADNAKSRGQYLELLELAVSENPANDRNMHYLGREYMFHCKWEKCIETLRRHLELPSAVWRDERCASMRFIAKAYENLNLITEEQEWIYKSIAEAPYLREPWIQASIFAARKQEWFGSLYFAEKAIEIKERSLSYINEANSWNEKPYDLAAVAAFYGGLYQKALDYGKTALTYNPNNERLLKNLEFYEKAVSKNT